MGFTAQQNVAQAQLVNSAATLAKALSEYYSDQGQIANATNWEMSTSDWRRLREQRLLNKALALKSELTPLTTGTPAPGDDYGITTATVTAFGALVAGFGNEIAQPGARRSSRKAETTAIPELDQNIREKLKAMDKLAEQFRAMASGDIFVDGYFNSREIIDAGHGPGDPATPPAPPRP